MRIIRATTHIFEGDDFPVLEVVLQDGNLLKTIIIRHEVLEALWETGIDSSASDVRFANPEVIAKIMQEKWKR